MAAQVCNDWRVRSGRRPGGAPTGGDTSAAVAASTLRFQPEGWLAWLVVLLAVLTSVISFWAMVQSIQTTHGAASEFWRVVGAAEDQVCAASRAQMIGFRFWAVFQTRNPKCCLYFPVTAAPLPRLGECPRCCGGGGVPCHGPHGPTGLVSRASRAC